MPLGYLSLVLHAHLPFVRHPEYDDFLEEDWLYEAITETYIPLLDVFEGLERDGVDWRMTMSVTPTLAAMLADPLLQYRYVRHLDNLLALAGKEIERTRWQPEFHHLALMYHTPLQPLPRGLRQPVRQQPAQRLPPLLRGRQARADHLRRHARLFAADGRQRERPQGPDRDRLPRVRAPLRPPAARASGCRSAATSEGIDTLLRDAGLRYFFTDTHGVLFAEPRPKYGVYAPILCPKSGVAALAPRHRVVQAGLERHRGLPRRLQLPRLLPRRRLRPRLRVPQAAPAPDRHPQPAGHQVLQDHRPDRPQAALRAPAPPWKRRPSTPATSCSTARSRSNGCPAPWTAGRR